ncbi:MAG: nucleotidyltransferase domain-containing protein [Candidatus Sumerlaeota bacterium]|nr:nucleotidyltransferase domain-containing protein [Candidatus Sumerlaeota bacterium]
MISDQLINAAIQSIVRETQPERIYLFGSYARGEQRADSDIDLLIEESKSFGLQNSRLEEINRISSSMMNSYNMPADILVYSSEEIAKWRQTTNHVVARALREGRLLYERPIEPQRRQRTVAR